MIDWQASVRDEIQQRSPVDWLADLSSQRRREPAARQATLGVFDQLAAAASGIQAAEVATMKAAALRVFSWILVIALVAPMALPAAASSTYVKSGGVKRPS